MVRVLPDPPLGALAQLGEHLLCKQGVVGSIPTGSTTLVGTNQLRTHKDLNDEGIVAVVCSLKKWEVAKRLRRMSIRVVEAKAGTSSP